MGREHGTDRRAGYVRAVRGERWLNLTVSLWLAAVALLAAAWLVAAALRRTGLSAFDILHLLR